jgi:hypothetical protein
MYLMPSKLLIIIWKSIVSRFYLNWYKNLNLYPFNMADLEAHQSTKLWALIIISILKNLNLSGRWFDHMSSSRYRPFNYLSKGSNHLNTRPVIKWLRAVRTKWLPTIRFQDWYLNGLKSPFCECLISFRTGHLKTEWIQPVFNWLTSLDRFITKRL